MVFLKIYFYLFIFNHQDSKLHKAIKRFLINHKKYSLTYEKGGKDKDCLTKAKLIYDYAIKEREDFNWDLVPYVSELTEGLKLQDFPPNMFKSLIS